MAEPDGLPSTGSLRVGHNWSDLAAATAAAVMRHSLWSMNSSQKHELRSQSFRSTNLHTPIFCSLNTVSHSPSSQVWASESGLLKLARLMIALLPFGFPVWTMVGTLCSFDSLCALSILHPLLGSTCENSWQYLISVLKLDPDWYRMFSRTRGEWNINSYISINRSI